MIEKRFIQQFARYIFKRTGISKKSVIGVKSNIDSSPFTDGDIDVNALKGDKRQDLSIDVDFLVGPNQNLNELKKSLFKPYETIFFVAEDLDRNIKFYWNKAKCLSLSDEASSQEEEGRDYQIFKAKFRLSTPFYFLADEGDIVYINSDTSEDLKYDTGLLYNGGYTYDSFRITSEFEPRSLTISQKQALFGLDVAEPKYRLRLRDCYFLREYDNKTFNYLKFTTDLTNVVWIKNDGTIAINSATGTSGNQDAVTFTCTSTFPYIQQRNILAVKGNNTFVVRLKQGAVGNATSFIMSIQNLTDGSTASSLKTIVSGKPLANGYYEHSFTATGSLQDSDYRVKIDFYNAAGNTPTANSTIIINDMSFYSARIIKSIPPYQPNPSGNQDYYMNWLQAFSYTLTANSTAYILTSNPLNLNTNVVSSVMAIRLQQLSQNDTVQVENLSNQTGFKITWLSSAVSPAFMIFYPHTRELVNGLTGEVITSYNREYKIEPLPTMFKLRALMNQDIEETSETYDNIKIIKNTTLSNYNILIKNLKMFI